ncbi:DUF3311 domain-containing protein [Dactylosporangium darangshiense]|uniref:DUF3311 domain-containing protein n=1 Tax=Dactylosporangium darangshiense TaxID=579108 RepID=UPI0036396B21
MPFFYWFQFAWIFLGAALMAVSYRLLRRTDATDRPSENSSGQTPGMRLTNGPCKRSPHQVRSHRQRPGLRRRPVPFTFTTITCGALCSFHRSNGVVGEHLSDVEASCVALADAGVTWMRLSATACWMRGHRVARLVSFWSTHSRVRHERLPQTDTDAVQ